MGAVVGVEYVDYFGHARAAGYSAEDLDCPYYIAYWFGPSMAAAGHTLKFLRSNLAVDETHLRDTTFGGDDGNNADSVDLYLIITHGSYEHADQSLVLQFDKPVYINGYARFQGRSEDWRFGDNCNLEWLMIYGCHSIDANNIIDHHHIFKRLHLICGSYGLMHDAWSVDEVGGDTADNLNAGMTVCDSWGDGVSDWYVANHPMVISVERADTWNNGNPRWPDTVIGCDHVWGKGYTFADIEPQDQYWMAAQWWDGGLRD